MHCQNRAVHCQNIGPKERRRTQAGGLPILNGAVRGGGRRLLCENPDEQVRTFNQVGAAGNDYGGPNFRFHCCGEHSDHKISRLQLESSGSSASSLRKDAVLKSTRSSSVHESDQSMLWPGESVASRSASADNSAAVSAGRRRKASTSDASREFSCISITLQPVYGAAAD